jgi:competence protein ComEA
MSQKPNQNLPYTLLRQRGLFVLSLLILIFLGFQYWVSAKKPGSVNRTASFHRGITIEARGSIHRPGLYTYLQPPTVERVVRDAEGLIEEKGIPASKAALMINRNATLIFRSAGQGSTIIDEGPLSVKALWILGRPIPINQAAWEDLDLVPGIGPGLARRIVDFRLAIGGFSSLDQLMEVDGIKEKTFEKIKRYLTL